MSSLVELFEFFERTHQSTLAKYRSNPWDLSKTKNDDFEIVDRLTKRHLAVVKPDGDQFIVTTTNLSSRAIGALKTEAEPNNPLKKFVSAHEAAQFVWRKETSWFQLGSWYMVSWVVLLADWLVALGKIALKILVGFAAISALWSILFGLEHANDGLVSDIVQVLLSLFPEKEPQS